MKRALLALLVLVGLWCTWQHPPLAVALVLGVVIGALGLAACLGWYGWRHYKRQQAKKAMDELLQHVENARRVRVNYRSPAGQHVETHPLGKAN